MEGAGAADESQRRALVDDFIAVTAATPDAAVFFLESHRWNLDSAVHSFFEAEEGGAAGDDDHHDALAVEEPPQPPPAAARQPAPAAPPSGASSGRDKKPSRSGAAGGGSRSGIRTLADLNRGSGHGSDSDDSDGPQEYFTGGEKSGMLVQDPSKGNHDVDALFDQARQMGASDGPLEHNTSSSSRSFTGTGRLLSGEPVQPAPQLPQNVNHNIYFWTNGFTINDGPLRRFDDPANASFLESIRKSECPKELEPADRRSKVSVNLIRKNGDCPEPVKRHVPFQGVGRTLGAGSSATPSAPEPAITATTVSSSPSGGLTVDASLPSTSIQLRLADGTRMVARFNTHHTVGHIRGFIDASRPGAARTYKLATVGFPPKLLNDLTQTIEQAGLANSVVIQKH